MNATRCKMRLSSIGEGYNNGRVIRFQAVSGGSEENKKFFNATPNGNSEFHISGDAAKSLGLEVASIGAEFYFDITPATPASPAS